MIAGIAVGAAVAVCATAAGITYLLRRRETSQKPAASKRWKYLDEAGEEVELQGRGRVQELEHEDLALPVEVQAQSIQELDNAAFPAEVQAQSIQELDNAAFPAEIQG